MTLQQLHQRIGQIQSEAARLAQRIEILDRRVDFAPPGEGWKLAAGAEILRANLTVLFTRLHSLEARLPTPELLSERAFNRMIALGLSIDAAEAGRVQAYRQAAHNQRYQHAA